LFLLVPSLHLANPRKGSKDKKFRLRQIEKNRERKKNGTIKIGQINKNE
jgi:hypothetical protein